MNSVVFEILAMLTSYSGTNSPLRFEITTLIGIFLAVALNSIFATIIGVWGALLCQGETNYHQTLAALKGQYRD